jgi:urease accessory protein
VRHAWRADGNPETLSELDALVEAALLAPAERTGSAHAGAALLTTHSRLETPGASSLNGSITRGEISGHRTVIEGAMWRAVGLTEAQAALLSGYGFVTTLATASVRLGHLGALAHQRLVARLLPEVASLATSPLPAGPVLRAFSPLAEIAIMRHPARDHALFAT